MHISNVKEFFAVLRSGQYTFPGGYPVYFITKDNQALSFSAAKEHAKIIARAIRDNNDSQWQVMGADVNWEDNELKCAHTCELIETAY